ncbi:MAG: SRPBCC domain-containing protein [Chitinophagales bacterium]|nr:SRPBCC domain-containing protein [Chitinophagales bacterium]
MNDLNSRTVTIERTFNASLELVWEAWTKPEHIAHWWGPKGMDVKVEEHNFIVGGTWKYTMLMPDGNEFISEGEYIEIEEGRKIVTTANFLPMTENVELHMLFEAKGEQTQFTFLVVHPTEEYRIQQEKMGIYNGWGSAFDRLEAFLEG